jgi:putative ABC transport system permease protein
LDTIETIRVAIRSIKSNKLRTLITSLIICLGITALVGTLTATDGIEKKIGDNFSSMGSNTISIRNRENSIHVSGRRKSTNFKFISYYQAKEFKNSLQYPAKVSISAFISMQALLKSAKEKSKPNCRLIGADENYLYTAGYKVQSGRNFNELEARLGYPVCIIGEELKNTLFPKSNALGQVITAAGGKYTVIGVLKPKGSSMGMGGGDRIMYIPIALAKSRFLHQSKSYTISVRVSDVYQLEAVAMESEGLMRRIRGLSLDDENNFGITRSDAMASKVIDNLKGVRLITIFIVFITLVGVCVALMNIMLVAITERTKEIGTRKAIGAKSLLIVKQFLIEALVICFIGGIAGVILGVLIGNLVATQMGTNFFMPWNWIFLGLVICLVTGLVSGIYPAVKASKLDPIEALRAE